MDPFIRTQLPWDRFQSISQHALQGIFSLQAQACPSLKNSLTPLFDEIQTVIPLFPRCTPFAKWLLSLPPIQVIATLTAEGLEPFFLLTIDAELGNIAIDRCLGNYQAPCFLELTPLRKSLIHNFAQQLLAALLPLCKALLLPHLMTAGIYNGPQDCPRPSNPFNSLSLGWHIEANDKSYSFALSLPSFSLLPCEQELSHYAPTSTKIPPPLSTSSIPLSLRLLLGEQRLSAEELQNLEEGDLLYLKERFDQPLTLKIGKETIAKGWPGCTNSHKGVLLAPWLKDSE